MCVRIRYSSAVPYTPYDPASNCICLPVPLPEDQLVNVVRAVLGEMAVEQPPVGARCFCGAPVRLAPRIPQQRKSEQQVSHHGA